MHHFKLRTTDLSLLLVIAVISLKFLPHSWGLPGIVCLSVGLIIAGVVDAYASPKVILRVARKAASCSCRTAIREVSKLPALLHKNCDDCGAEVV